MTEKQSECADFNAKAAVNAYRAKRRTPASAPDSLTCSASILHARSAARMSEIEQATDGVLVRIWKRVIEKLRG